MGVYSIIDTKKNCPICGSKVEWQSKDITIDEIYPVIMGLHEYKLNKRMTSGEVHTLCDKCKTWIEADIKNGRIINLKIEKSN